MDKPHQHREPFQQVWTEPAHDFNDVPVRDVWVIYDGEPRSLDTALHNTFHTYLMEELRNAGVYAFPSISYIITRTAWNNRAYIPHCVDRLKYPRTKPRSPGAQGTGTPSAATLSDSPTLVGSLRHPGSVIRWDRPLH